mgnify:CR=1 FL=1
MPSPPKGVKIKSNTISTFLIIFIIIAAFLSFYVLSYKTQDCQRDESCFRQNELQCKRSKVEVIKEGNLFLYQIEKKRQNNCYIKVSVLEVNPESSQELKKAFESKSMTCTIPLDQIKKTSTISNNDVFDLCTGPLKEATYELIIKKLYSVIAQNLGPILQKADEAINQTKNLR